MVTSEAVTRILWHAGLPFLSTGEELRPGSMTTATWKLAGIEEACEDLLRALERLNVEVNGAVPSAVNMDGKANDFSRTLVWAVEGIRGDLNQAWEKSQTESLKDSIEVSMEKVNYWWKCVLDGDIDDIPADWQAYLQTQL